MGSSGDAINAASNEASMFAFYRYDPSMAGAVIFTVLFTITTLWHAVQLFRTRTWFFIPFLVGGIFEIIGYIGRALSSHESPNWTLGPYLIQTLFLLLAPALLAASVYMLLGRIILILRAESHAILSKKWLTKIFVTGDVLSFFLQGAGESTLAHFSPAQPTHVTTGASTKPHPGGGIQSSGSLDNMKLGERIIVAGLFVQIFFFGFFIVTAGSFHLKLRKYPIPRCHDPSIPWRKHLNILYATSFLIMVRSVFRLVEYLQGNDGYLLHHEIFLYIFDAVLIFVAMLLFNIFHPSELAHLLREAHEYELQSTYDKYEV
ncbi:RTA1 domain protein [Aspergillus nomiae NRRL 13137]|uniref:RTA1 domain protein n=1 Tax=Aspergillus nomiae NRRL (strain ATCC 15546 / NRRL 13137 / CBS 260.88 / M93) TaxID=1509407 RepID=A0A0L1J9X4_ASPN3|nr:RTA1 domain protein [Aspergillus nomiae NRRL 13137]KNG88490.1 RTA1 domain protein [Aspergillus nomiae NRRL 13137]